MTATITLAGAFLLWLARWLTKGQADFTFAENPQFFVALVLSATAVLLGGVVCMAYAFFGR